MPQQLGDVQGKSIRYVSSMASIMYMRLCYCGLLHAWVTVYCVVIHPLGGWDCMEVEWNKGCIGILNKMDNRQTGRRTDKLRWLVTKWKMYVGIKENRQTWSETERLRIGRDTHRGCLSQKLSTNIHKLGSFLALYMNDCKSFWNTDLSHSQGVKALICFQKSKNVCFEVKISTFCTFFLSYLTIK